MRVIYQVMKAVAFMLWIVFVVAGLAALKLVGHEQTMQAWATGGAAVSSMISALMIYAVACIGEDIGAIREKYAPEKKEEWVAN